MSNQDAASGPGTTDDPNQATNTGLPKKEDVTPEPKTDQSSSDDPTSGPGTTSDPNQANLT